MKNLVVVCCVLFNLIVAELAPAQPAGGDPTKEEVNIGAIYSVTGEASFWGNYGLNGLRMAIDEENAKGGIDGKKINLIVQDSQTKPAMAVSAYHWLRSVMGVKAVAGDIWDFLIASFMPLSGTHGILHVAPLAAPAENPSRTFFSTGTKAETIADALDRFFKLHSEIKTVALFGWDDPWGQGYTREWEKACRNNNIKIVYQFLNPVNWAYDYKSDIAKAVRLKPDLVIIAHQSERIIKLFAEYKYKPKFLSTSNFVEVWHRKLLPDALLEGVYFTDWPPTGEFVQKFEKQYGTYPLFSAADNYEIGKVIVEALRHNPDDPSAYVKTLKYKGSTGEVDFTQSYWGNNSKASLMQIKDNKMVKVE